MFPGVNGPKWDDRKMRAFADIKTGFVPEPEKDWIGIHVNGTTFSGHPTRTTLGNTLRQILYAFFYIE